MVETLANLNIPIDPHLTKIRLNSRLILKYLTGTLEQIRKAEKTENRGDITPFLIKFCLDSDISPAELRKKFGDIGSGLHVKDIGVIYPEKIPLINALKEIGDVSISQLNETLKQISDLDLNNYYKLLSIFLGKLSINSPEDVIARLLVAIEGPAAVHKYFSNLMNIGIAAAEKFINIVNKLETTDNPNLTAELIPFIPQFSDYISLWCGVHSQPLPALLRELEASKAVFDGSNANVEKLEINFEGRSVWVSKNQIVINNHQISLRQGAGNELQLFYFDQKIKGPRLFGHGFGDLLDMTISGVIVTDQGVVDLHQEIEEDARIQHVINSLISDITNEEVKSKVRNLLHDLKSLLGIRLPQLLSQEMSQRLAALNYDNRNFCLKEGIRAYLDDNNKIIFKYGNHTRQTIDNPDQNLDIEIFLNRLDYFAWIERFITQPVETGSELIYYALQLRYSEPVFTVINTDTKEGIFRATFDNLSDQGHRSLIIQNLNELN
jgi:hypothetical protein